MTLKNRRNIQAVYDLATTAEYANGLAWYAIAHCAALSLAEDYGVTECQAIGVIAALSPRNKWKRNVADAEALIAAYVAAGPKQAQITKVCTFGANKAKAIRILELVDPTSDEVRDVLRGPKLREFYSCIIGQQSEICIDGHAYCIWAGGRTSLKDVPSIGVKLRREIKKDYAKVAADLGVKPAALQAITWVAWRRLHNV